MKKNDIDIDDDMSKTFIAEVGQKSAIADDEEVLEKNTNESNFPDISIEPPKEEINTNEIGTNIEEKETKPRYEEESSMYDETKKKKSNPLLTVLLTILALAIGAGGSYYYFEVLNKEVVSTKVEEKEEVRKDTAEELKPDSLFVKNLVTDYDYYTVFSTDLYNVLYSQEKLEVNSLDESYKRALVAIKASRFLGNVGFSGEDFQLAVKELFGPNMTLENKDFDVGCAASYEYDQENDYYSFKESGGCGGTSFSSLERKIVKAVKKDDKLEINVAVAIKNTEEDKVYKNYVTNPDGTDASQVVEGVTATTFDIDKDYSKLNQYKYTFNYDVENNNYYLASIELMK